MVFTLSTHELLFMAVTLTRARAPGSSNPEYSSPMDKLVMITWLMKTRSLKVIYFQPKK